MEGPRTHPKLSEREGQLITLATAGLTDTAIANRLGISEPTVKSYWGRVRIKLGPHGRTELVAHALKEESQHAIAELNAEIDRLRSAREVSSSGAPDLQREMLENAPDAVFAVDGEGCFLWLNLEAERMFGYRFDEIVGEHVSILIPHELRSAHRIHMNQYFEIPERKKMGEHLATVGLRKSGDVFSIAATLASVAMPNKPIVACFVREVTEGTALARYAERYGVVVD